MLVGGCSKEKPSPENDGAILLVPVMDERDALTRATLYQNEDDLRGDTFHVQAYLSEGNDPYFNSDVRYSAEALDVTKHQWRFYEPIGNAGQYKYMEYYWPIGHSLDFFAYAPSDCSYVEVNVQSNPPAFTATIPLSNADTENEVHQDNMKEFMYAYAPGQDKSSGPVSLDFKHPFAGIVFKVAQSHRDLTVKSITVNGIYNKGTCSIADSAEPEWTLTSNGDLILSIEKEIPGEVNFGGELCDPYLVLPQENSTQHKGITVKFHWIGNKDENWTEVAGEDNTYIISGEISNDWSVGKIYTYSLNLGNSREEILFEVSVQDWKYVYEHEFEIE